MMNSNYIDGRRFWSHAYRTLEIVIIFISIIIYRSSLSALILLVSFPSPLSKEMYPFVEKFQVDLGKYYGQSANLGNMCFYYDLINKSDVQIFRIFGQTTQLPEIQGDTFGVKFGVTDSPDLCSHCPIFGKSAQKICRLEKIGQCHHGITKLEYISTTGPC